MKILEKKELKSVEGGGFFSTLLAVAVVSFVCWVAYKVDEGHKNGTVKEIDGRVVSSNFL